MGNDRAFAWPEDGQEHYDAPNPASAPAACGLEILAEISDPDLAYEFNVIMAFRDTKTHAVYLAQSSGCSCPQPFEEFTCLADMTHIRTADDARAFVRAAQPTDPRDEPNFLLRDVLHFLAIIDLALSTP